MNAWRHCGWRRWIAAVLIAALVAPTLSGCATPRAPATVVLSGIAVDGTRAAVKGESAGVRVWRDGQWLDGVPGMPLRSGDRVVAAARTDVVIDYPSGTRLYMRPGSSGRIGSFVEAIGEFFARVKGAFAIETQFVQAAADGTAYWVRAGRDGTTQVMVIEGRVRVDSTQRAWTPRLVEPGWSVLAHPQAPVPARADPALMRSTAEWVDGLDRIVPEPGTAKAGRNVAAVAAAAALVAILLGGGGKDRPAADDKPEVPQRDAPRLAAPTDLRPGAPDERKPELADCQRTVTLSWSAVPGARNYVVTLATRGPNDSAWGASATRTTDATQLVVGAARATLYRWSVQAQVGNQAGPASRTEYFLCR